MFPGVVSDLVPRYFNILAEINLDSSKLDPNNADGPFVLGTLHASLTDPFRLPLNRGQHRVEIPDNNVWKFTRSMQKSESMARYSTRLANSWLRLDCSASSQLNTTCDTVQTKYFHPAAMAGYIGQSLDSEPIKKWLNGKRKAELYMITGIQVGQGLRVTATTNVGLGSKFGYSAKEIEHEIVPKMDNAVIVSYRATKYTLFRRNLFNRWKSRDLDHGDWMIRGGPVLVRDADATVLKNYKAKPHEDFLIG